MIVRTGLQPHHLITKGMNHMPKSLTELAAEIITAQLSHTQMSKDQVKGSLREVFEVLSHMQDTEARKLTRNEGKPAEQAAPQAVAETHLETSRAPEPAKATPQKRRKSAVQKKREQPAAGSPTVSPRESVLEDKVICLECGAGFKQLTHLHLQRHGLTVNEYKRKHGLPKGQALIAKTLSEAKRQKAKELGLGEKLQKAKQGRA